MRTEGKTKLSLTQRKKRQGAFDDQSLLYLQYTVFGLTTTIDESPQINAIDRSSGDLRSDAQGP